MNVDRKQMIMLAVVGIGLVGAAIYLIMNLTGGPGGSTNRKTTANTNIPVRLETVDIDINVNKLLSEVKPVMFDYRQSRIQRDPMKPLVWSQKPIEGEAEGEGSGPLDPGFMTVRMKQITGIIWDEKKPLAVVDDEVIYEGFKYPKSGVVVDSILKDAVIFRVNDMLITVEMKEQ